VDTDDADEDEDEDDDESGWLGGSVAQWLSGSAVKCTVKCLPRPQSVEVDSGSTV